MATLDDILTTQKNGVVAINNLNQTNAYFSGRLTSSTVTSQSLIVTGSGFLVNFSVVVGGSASGTINNAQSIANVAASNALVSTPTTAGVYQCGCHFTNGLILTPGTGQSINVTYSLDP